MREIMGKSLSRLLVFSVGLIGLSSCTGAYRESVGYDVDQSFSRVFLTDFNTAWQAVLDALKSSSLDVSNREAGFIQTKWTDNTSDKNFTDSFGGSDAYLKAQLRLKVNIAKGFFNGLPSIKVTIKKEQLVQRDVLEGWVPIQTDDIDENTLLYRIGRLIYIRMKIAALEDQKAKEAVE